MASSQSLRVLERRNERIDAHIRALINSLPPPNVVVTTALSINFLIDGGGGVIGVGIQGALRVDFDCTITGSFLQEIDGNTGSIQIGIESSVGGATPVWTSIVGVNPPIITTGRFDEDVVLTGWTTSLTAGSYLRWSVDSVTVFTRILSVLRVLRSA